MVLFLGIGPPLLILVSVLVVGTLIHIRRGHRHSGQRPSCSTVHFPSRGRARWVGGRRWRLSRRRQFPRKMAFYFPCILFWVEKTLLFFQGKVFYYSLLLDMLVAGREPTPCYRDAYSVGTPNRAFWVKGWLKHGKTMVSKFVGRFFLVSKRTIYFFFLGGRGRSFMGSLYI